MHHSTKFGQSCWIFLLTINGTNLYICRANSFSLFIILSGIRLRMPMTPILKINPSFNYYYRRVQTVMNSSKEPLLDQTPHEGAFIQISVNLPPTMQEPGFLSTSSAFVKITTLDHDNHRAAWCTEGLPKFLLQTERWQALSVDEATGKTKYETIEVFGGFLAYFVKFFVGKNLILGFQAFANGLKKCAEESSP